MRLRKWSCPTINANSQEPAMIEFALTARGLYFRLQASPEALVLILILARVLQRFL